VYEIAFCLSLQQLIIPILIAFCLSLQQASYMLRMKSSWNICTVCLRVQRDLPVIEAGSYD